MMKRLALFLVLVMGLGVFPHVAVNAAATLDRSVCSTADKAGGNPSLCDGQELIDSANQELSKLYDGNALVVQSVTGTNAIAGSTIPAATALVDGAMRQLKPAAINTTTVTYNDNGLGAKQLVSAGGLALAAGDLQSTTVYLIRYYSTNDEWRVLTNLGTGSASSSNPFVTIGNTSSLGNERALTAGNCITSTDGGANSSVTVAVGSCSSANLATAITDETGSGANVFATSPTLVTPTLGDATATTVNKVTITAPATGATLTIPDGVTLTGPAASGTAMTLGNNETVTGVKTFGAPGNVGKLVVAGTTSGTTTLNATAVAGTTTLTLPAATDTLVARTTTDTLTNKSIDLTNNTLTSTSAQLATALTNETGSGSAVFATSPSLTTPVIGGAGMTFTGSTSGTTTLAATAIAGTTALTLPAATDTLVGKATTDTLTNKSINLANNTLTSTSAQLSTALSDETGSGAAVFATSPSLTTPTLGVASATTVNKVTITAPATAATLTIPDGVTMTGPAASGTVMTLGNNETVTGVKTFGAAGNVGKLAVAGTTSGSTVIAATAVAGTTTVTLPAATDTLVGKATTDTLTNKTIDLTSNTLTTTSAQLATAITNETGSGSAVFATSPTLTSPTLTTPTVGGAGMTFTGSTSGTTTLTATAVAGTTALTLPAATDTLVGKATTDTLTNKTISGASNTLSNIGNASLTNSATTVNSQTCTLGSTCTVTVPVATGVTGLGTNVATALATPSSANVAAAITDETGSGAAVFATSPTLVTPALGTPSSATLTNATGLPISSGVSGLGTGVATALGVNVGTAGAPVVNGGALGTPSSGTLTNATGLPISSGVSGLGTGVATALGNNVNSSGGVATQSGAVTSGNCVRFAAGGGIEDSGGTCGGGGGGGSPGGSSGNIQYNNAGSFGGLTDTQVTARLDAFVGDSGSGGTKGAVPAPAAGDAAANKFLKADGTWVRPPSMAFIGTVVGTNSNVDLALGATYTSIIGQCTIFNGASGTQGATVAVSDDNASTFGTGLTWGSVGLNFGLALGSFTLSGTGTAATNKVLTPTMLTAQDVDASPATGTYTTTATESTKTGVTTHLRFTSANASTRWSCTVFGIL